MKRDISLASAMDKRTERGEGCWKWLGNVCTSTGYGRLTFQGNCYAAHRAAYELAKGPIPAGLVIDHLCRNRACVNPEHLEAVTRRENTLRGEGVTARRLRSEECARGHRLDESNTIVQRGARLCRTCRDARTKVATQKRRESRQAINPRRFMDMDHYDPSPAPRERRPS